MTETKVPANINGSKVVIVITDSKDDGGAAASPIYLRHSHRGVTFTTIWPDPDGSYASDANVEAVNSTVFGGIKEQP